MERFLEIIGEYNTLIMIGIMCLLLILIILQLVNKIQLSRLSRKYKKLFRTSKKENIEDMIIEYGNRVEEILDYTKNVHRAYRGIDDRIASCTQKVGVVRYKAFDDIGSDLSFSIALLDESDTGVVLTGIYGRNDSTTFAKPIDNGISKYDLSDEEKESMDRARKLYEKNNKYRMEDIEDIEGIKEFIKRPKNDYVDNDKEDNKEEYGEIAMDKFDSQDFTN